MKMKITERQLRRIIRESLEPLTRNFTPLEAYDNEVNPNAYGERAVAQELIEELGKAIERFPGFDGLSAGRLETDGPGYGTPYKSFRLRIDAKLEGNPVQGLGEEGDFYDAPEGMDEYSMKDEFDYIINNNNMKQSRPIKKYSTHIEQYSGRNSLYYIYSITIPGLHPNEDY